MAPPSTVLVTGANRGIGLGLVKEFLKLSEVKLLFATARNPDQATELNAIGDKRLHVVKLDVQKDETVQQAFTQECPKSAKIDPDNATWPNCLPENNSVSKQLGDNGLNLLVNNAGIWTNYPVNDAPNRSALNNIFDANATSPLIISQTFLPLLRKSADPNNWGVHTAGIVNISSGMASIGDNTSGSGRNHAIAYRMSKAALNQMMKTLSFDLAPEGILTMSFCPGWVRTDMGGENAYTSVDESAHDLVKTICGLNKDQTGAYMRRGGNPIPY